MCLPRDVWHTLQDRHLTCQHMSFTWGKKNKPLKNDHGNIVRVRNNFKKIVLIFRLWFGYKWRENKTRSNSWHFGSPGVMSLTIYIENLRIILCWWNIHFLFTFSRYLSTISVPQLVQMAFSVIAWGEELGDKVDDDDEHDTSSNSSVLSLKQSIVHSINIALQHTH